MDIFFEIHKDLPREGPGSDEATRQAFQMLPALPPGAQVLDVGCGPGMQTLELARLVDGQITAVDTHQPFLDELRRRAEAAGLQDKIQPRQHSMFSLDFPPGSFDLIWSEGAIYIIGFEQGLRAWRPLLKPGGCLVASEITWLKSDPPAELRDYWAHDYPGMRSLPQNLAMVEKAGYRHIGHFVLPASGWWDHYYRPLQTRLEKLRPQYADDPEALEMLDENQREIDLFRRYSAWYSYVFYLAQKV